jgi:hypothetical protein
MASFSEKSIDFPRAAWSYITEVMTIHNHRCGAIRQLNDAQSIAEVT